MFSSVFHLPTTTRVLVELSFEYGFRANEKQVFPFYLLVLYEMDRLVQPSPEMGF